MTVVLGTAGHIDHGKTALLRALTGIDADRLPEERRRGMTIDVGYAHLRLPDGDELDFVDVPGHDRLVGNMLVGAGEIDAALLVVAADDGPRAQTLEHLELLDGLGIDVGLVAVSKVDLVDEARLAEVVRHVSELLGPTSLAGSPIVPVSSVRGDGIDALRVALEEARDRVVARVAGGGRRWPRLAVDRAFTVRGRGLVVTGSLRGGPLSRGDAPRLEPSGRTLRIREVQVHGAAVQTAGGGRVALNLVGLDDPPPTRGDVVTSDPSVRATADLLAVIRPGVTIGDRSGRRAGLPASGSSARMHIGTAQVDATLGRGPRAFADLTDGRRVVRLRLGEPIAVAPGDRFVLRRPAPGGTVAGGVVVDVAPPVGPSRRRITTTFLRALGENGGDETVLLALHGVRPAGAPLAGASPATGGSVTVSGGDGWVLAPDVQAVLRGALAGSVADAGAAGLRVAELRTATTRRVRRLATVTPAAAAAIVAKLIDTLVAEGVLVRDRDLVRGAAFETPIGPSADLLAAMDRLERALDVAAPPALAAAATEAGCPAQGIRALLESGRIVRLEDDLAYAAPAFDRMQEAALRIASIRPLAPADLRDATGTSRRYVMAVLEELDRRGVLRRTPDGHVVGPRAPR